MIAEGSTGKRSDNLESFMRYRIANVDVRLSCSSEDLLVRTAAWLATHFYVQGSEERHGAAIHLHVKAQSLPPRRYAEARVLQNWPNIRIYLQDKRCFLVFAGVGCELDFDERRGIVWLEPDFWDLSPKLQIEPFTMAMVWLLREHGSYSLHADAVLWKDRGILIVGDSGCGKSTTALGLIRRGCRYLSDDVTVLEPTGAGIRLWPLARGFGFAPALTRWFPELANRTSTRDRNGKVVMDIAAVYPDRHILTGVPDVLLFPRVVDQYRSQLIPLDPVERLSELIVGAGPLVATDRHHATRQLNLLNKLSADLPGYRLRAGRDLLDGGAVLEDLLTAHGVGA